MPPLDWDMHKMYIGYCWAGLGRDMQAILLHYKSRLDHEAYHIIQLMRKS